MKKLIAFQWNTVEGKIGEYIEDGIWAEFEEVGSGTKETFFFEFWPYGQHPLIYLIKSGWFGGENSQIGNDTFHFTVSEKRITYFSNENEAVDFQKLRGENDYVAVVVIGKVSMSWGLNYYEWRLFIVGPKGHHMNLWVKPE